MAAQDATLPAERARLDTQCERYTRALRRHLEETA